MSKKDAKETSHKALYRTYRPQEFKDVKGQEQVVEVLETAAKNGSIAHAYLFSGTRGTGKTTMARIFAKAIGCTEKDLYEMDAASNNSVEDVRQLRDAVHVLPFESPYKVYIVDEAHMLSNSAWNAFLKTLEEPPPHVVFILATTELHKVPDTIQSRCEVYSLKQPSRDILSKTLIDVAKKEGSEIEKDAAELVAILAEGSFRDGLGILQKVLTVANGKKVDAAVVEKVTGAPSGELVRTIVRGLADHDTAQALTALEKAVEANTDMRVLAKLLMHRVRSVLLLRNAPDMKSSVEDELGDEDMKLAEELAKEKAITSNTLRALLDAYSTMNYAALPHVPLELAVIDLCAKEE